MSLEFWRNVAVIWLCLQAFIMLLIPLAISYLLVRGINWVVRKTPPIFHKGQEYSSLMRSKTEAYAEKAAAPVISAHARAAKVQTVLERLTGRAEETHYPRSSSTVTVVKR